MDTYDWHTCPMKALLDERERLAQERDTRYEQRFKEQEKAVRLADEQTQHWRDQANEWRQAMTDRETNFLPRAMGYVTAIISVLAFVLGLWHVTPK